MAPILKQMKKKIKERLEDVDEINADLFLKIDQSRKENIEKKIDIETFLKMSNIR